MVGAHLSSALPPNMPSVCGRCGISRGAPTRPTLLLCQYEDESATTVVRRSIARFNAVGMLLRAPGVSVKGSQAIHNQGHGIAVEASGAGALVRRCSSGRRLMHT